MSCTSEISSKTYHARRCANTSNTIAVRAVRYTRFQCVEMTTGSGNEEETSPRAIGYIRLLGRIIGIYLSHDPPESP